MKLLIILLLLFPVRAEADEKQVANAISWGTVLTQIGLDTYRSFKSDDKKKEFLQQGLRTGLTIGVSELLKYFIHEERPDGSDNKSFPSEHSAIGCTATSLKKSDGWQFGLSIGLAIGTPVGRVVAEKHHWWDTAVGCGIGLSLNALTEHYVR